MEPFDAEGYQHTSESLKKELRFKVIDASGPQRFEMLESNGGELKVELSHIKAQAEQMMGIMQQLLHAKLADGGQQDKKSGDTCRGDANNDSGGAGRESREEAAAGVRVGTTTPTAAGGRVSSHSSAERRMDQDLPTTRAGDQRFWLAWA